jgi:toxin ParE1/3/4
MSHRVVFSPDAQEQLVALYRFIAQTGSPDTAARYTQAIVDYCESLANFPQRGTMRDDVRPGLRVTNYRKRTVIAFAVDAEQLAILGIYYGGQDYASILQDESVEDSSNKRS